MEDIKVRGKMKIPARATFFYMGSTIIGKAAGLLVTPIFTRVMDTAEYGAYSYYISLIGVVSLLSSIFLSPAVIYSGLGKFSNENSVFSNSTILLSIISNSLICMVLFTFHKVFDIYLYIVVFIFLQILFDSIITSELLSGKYLYNYKKVVIINLTSSFLSPAISLFLILFFKMGALGRMLGLLFSSGLIAILFFIKRIKNRPKISREHIGFLLKNSLPLIPATLARATMGWSDKLIIKSELGLEALGKYSVAHTVGMALFGIIASICSALNPWLVRKLSSGKRENIFPIVKNLSDLIAFATAFIVGLAPEIFSFLAPESYTDSLYAIIPFALSTVPYFLFGVASVFITYKEHTKFISLSAFAGALLNLALNLLLISRLGFIGGAVSYLISETVIYLLALRLLRSCDSEAERSLKSFYPLSFSLCSAIILYALYPYLPIRLIFLIIPAVLAVNRGFKCLMLTQEN